MSRVRIRYGKFISRLLVLVLLIYGAVRCGLWLYENSRQYKIETEMTQVTRRVSGYILRDETVIRTTNGGTVSYYVQDGDKVQPGQKIATIVASGETGPTGALTPQQQLEQNTKRIQALDGEIQTLMNALSDGVKYKQLIGLAGIKTDVTLKINERQKLASVNESLQKGIKPDEGTGAAVQARRGQHIDILSPDSGIVSFYSDGLEDAFQPAAYRSLNLKGVQFKEPSGIAVPQIKPGGILFKLVSGTEWYMAVPITPADRKTLDKIQSVTLKIGQETVKASVQDTIENPSGILLILQVHGSVGELTKKRKLDAEVTLDNYRGVSVPKDSLVTSESKRGILRIEANGRLTFVPVEVLSEKGETCILSEGSFYTADGGSVKETRTVKSGDRIIKNPRASELDKALRQE